MCVKRFLARLRHGELRAKERPFILGFQKILNYHDGSGCRPSRRDSDQPVGGLHRDSIVSDAENLAVFGEIREEIRESTDIRLVEGRVHLVENDDPAAPVRPSARGEGQNEGKSRKSLFPAGE